MGDLADAREPIDPRAERSIVLRAAAGDRISMAIMAGFGALSLVVGYRFSMGWAAAVSGCGLALLIASMLARVQDPRFRRLALGAAALERARQASRSDLDCLVRFSPLPPTCRDWAARLESACQALEAEALDAAPQPLGGPGSLAAALREALDELADILADGIDRRAIESRDSQVGAALAKLAGLTTGRGPRPEVRRKRFAAAIAGIRVALDPPEE